MIFKDMSVRLFTIFDPHYFPYSWKRKKKMMMMMMIIQQQQQQNEVVANILIMYVTVKTKQPQHWKIKQFLG